MKKTEVQLGSVYKCKVSGKLVSVKITNENPSGGWQGLNLNTGKSVRIKSAQRLRTRVANSAPKAKTATKATTPAKQGPTGERGGKGGKPVAQPGDHAKPLSLIKAAICVMQSCERPMNCKEIVTKAMDAKIWTPRNGGLTPANTLSAAIRREIKTKGDASRFVMAERGKFAIATQK